MAERAPAIAERLKAIQALLSSAPPAASHDEAFAMLTKIINDYEDAHSGVPYAPDVARLVKDGRIYPPEADAEKKSGIEGARRYRTRGHHVFVGMNGALTFQNVATKEIEFSKPGHDGKEINV